MRVIPVIDLKGGAAVHAVRGERERYRPLRSRIAAGSDPVGLTRAVRARFGLEELYVADLDAIAGGPGNPAVLAALAGEARVMVDAGAATPARQGSSPAPRPSVRREGSRRLRTPSPAA